MRAETVVMLSINESVLSRVFGRHNSASVEGVDFPFPSGLLLLLQLQLLLPTKARMLFFNPAVEPVVPLPIYSIVTSTMISSYKLPDSSGRRGAHSSGRSSLSTTA